MQPLDDRRHSAIEARRRGSTPQTCSISLGLDYLWGCSRHSERTRHGLRSRRSAVPRARRRYDSCRNGRHGVDSDQLWSDGVSVSLRRIGVHLCWAQPSPYFGFVAGWAMLLCYVVCPLFCVIYGSLALQRAVPALPYPVSAALFAVGITFLNLRGIRSTAHANDVLCAFMFVVLLAYIVLAIRYVTGHHGIAGLFSIRPFYSPSTFNVRDIARATSFSALTYLGFDAVTTLAEDVKNPRRNVMLAAVLVIVFTGVFGGLMVYLGQLVWPDYQTYFGTVDGITPAPRPCACRPCFSQRQPASGGTHDFCFLLAGQREQILGALASLTIRAGSKRGQ